MKRLSHKQKRINKYKILIRKIRLMEEDEQIEKISTRKVNRDK